MSAIVTTMFVCDVCGEALVKQAGYSQSVAMARKDKWQHVKKKTLCPKCVACGFKLDEYGSISRET